MRSTLIPLLGLALALGCDQTGPLSPELRGLQGCFGELVIVTGTIRIKEHTMTSTTTGNQDHTSFTFISNGIGVGQETGRI